MAIKTEFLCELSADLEQPLELGATPHGTRTIVYAKGGTFEGPRRSSVMVFLRNFSVQSVLSLLVD